MSASVASWQASYRRAFTRRGERIEIRRGQGADLQKITVRARVKGFAPDELVGDIQQGDRQVIILAEDVTLDPPFSDEDRLVVRGRPLDIQAIDDSTRRVGEVLLAYIVQARGH